MWSKWSSVVVSMRFLLGSEAGDEADQRRAAGRLSELQRLATRLLAGGGLLVTYKGALERLELPDTVSTLHLGNLRGRDGFKQLDTAVISGAAGAGGAHGRGYGPSSVRRRGRAVADDSPQYGDRAGLLSAPNPTLPDDSKGHSTAQRPGRRSMCRCVPNSEPRPCSNKSASGRSNRQSPATPGAS